MVLKNVTFVGGGLASRRKKADSNAYFMYLLLHVCMMVTMFVSCGASV